MDRKRAIFILTILLLVVAVSACFHFWPKRYTVGENMQQAFVFWNDHDAFVFLDLNVTGRAQNPLQEKMAGTRYWFYLAAMTGNYIGFAKQDVVAYHLASDGKLDRFALPGRTTIAGSWSLTDGQLQHTPPAGFGEGMTGFRWDGTKFVPAQVAARPHGDASSAKGTTLLADDDEDARDFGFMDATARQQFKAAGWHYKLLGAYIPGGATEATLPIALAGDTFNLTIESPLRTQGGLAGFDPLAYGATSLRLSGDKLATNPQVLWSRTGWHEVSQSEYERLRQQDHRRQYGSSYAWLWLVALAMLFLWRVSGWVRLLLTFATMKKRVLKNMATSFSFPPATPAQFPLLNTNDLDRYTRELEGMGFTRLLDFSLVSDSRANIPSFCRLFAHTRHHCFAVLNQFFPKAKSPTTLNCSIESSLQNGWNLGFNNRKPLATNSLLRRRKALGVSMPDATISELLQAFLRMREQVCLDLGISPVNDDSFGGYVQKMQRSLGELRDAVQDKNFATGLPEVYLRKLSLLKTKPEYVWLGDYPKEAEKRKSGMGTFAVGTS